MVNIRKKKILLSLLVIIIILQILNVQSNKIRYVNGVADYFIEEKGYREEEMKSIDGVWGKKMPAYYVVVVLANGPNIKYSYFAHGKVS